MDGIELCLLPVHVSLFDLGERIPQSILQVFAQIIEVAPVEDFHRLHAVFWRIIDDVGDKAF